MEVMYGAGSLGSLLPFHQPLSLFIYLFTYFFPLRWGPTDLWPQTHQSQKQPWFDRSDFASQVLGLQVWIHA